MNGEIQNQTTNWEALDEINLEILQILQVEGNISNADLSRRVGLTPPSVLQRVRKLEQSGYIQGYHAALNPLTFGFGLTVFVQLSLSLSHLATLPEFRQDLADFPEILEIYHVSGEFDFLLKVLTRSMSEYEQIINRLVKVNGVGKVQSCFVMHTAKSGGPLPIGNSPAQ